ncbi:restriction endonuclease [Actinomyces slackii]|uniref:EcoKMrr n=1 Tax=Actinomyces slackii TaxID=52774 RepID=A0A3S4WIA7_9ACTO|nr:restriction endonuclease [Actinomyces slackii]VEG73481.1 EcoKMrr [Actinomyces slackii]
MVIAEHPAPDDTRAIPQAREPRMRPSLSWEQLLVPLLRILDDGRVQQFRVLERIVLGQDPTVPDLEREALPGGRRPSDSRAALALSHLVRIDAIERPARGQFRITDLGRQILDEYPEGLTQEDVAGLAEYAVARRRMAGRHATNVVPIKRTISAEVANPIHQIADGIERLRQSVTAELLQRIHAQDPDCYGHTILTLLEAMGYGVQGHEARAHATADGGIEAVLEDDSLGLSRIYVQAKRLAPTGLPTGRPVIQAFVREAQRRGLVQGLFITTGELTADAWAYAERSAIRTVLIDGEGLAGLMMRHGIGVRATQTFEILQVDEVFFA